MAMCSWHHTYKVTYRMKKENGFPGPFQIDYVEAPNKGMAMFQVADNHGGALNCQVWKAEQVD